MKVDTFIPTNQKILSIRNIKDTSEFWFELQLADLSFVKCNQEEILYFNGKDYVILKDGYLYKEIKYR